MDITRGTAKGNDVTFHGDGGISINGYRLPKKSRGFIGKQPRKLEDIDKIAIGGFATLGILATATAVLYATGAMDKALEKKHHDKQSISIEQPQPMPSGMPKLKTATITKQDNDKSK